MSLKRRLGFGSTAPRPYCIWCEEYRDPRGFDKHTDACKRHTLAADRYSTRGEQNSNNQVRGNSVRVVLRVPTRHLEKAIPAVNSFRDAGPSTGALCFAHTSSVIDLAPSACYPADSEASASSSSAAPPAVPLLSPRPSPPELGLDIYIKYEFHPHSKQETIIVPLDGVQVTPRCEPIPLQGASLPAEPVLSDQKPWAPFRTRPDFEYAESAIRGRFSSKTIDSQLRGMHGTWANGCNITFKNHADMARSVDAARQTSVQVRCLSI